ncbi:MAG: hypothetical protein JWN39_1180 [Ilumatobacteraceae bacterium]|nr:hypothetical protein [Ilumatobacteraceae bacterium]
MISDDGQSEIRKGVLSRRGRLVDATRAVGAGLVGAIPLVGSPVVGLIDAAWPTLWQRRVDELLRQIDARLSSVEAHKIERDEVITAVALAMRSAVVSDDEKISYLASAVANTADDSGAWQQDIVVVLMRLVDELTASHFRILDLLVDPSAWIARTGILLEQPPDEDGGYRLTSDIRLALETAGTPVGDIALILGDLESRGLLNTGGIGDEVSSAQPKSIGPALVSSLGRRVHRFVTWIDTDNAASK